MELRESIEHINYKLEREYGRHSDGRPNFRVVFSEDQFENRLTNFTDEGFELINPEVRLLPKYKQYITARYILERLVPVRGETDLTVNESYEPAWVFQDRNQNYLPPFFEGCRYVIDSIMEKAGVAGHVKYKDPLASPEERAANLQRVQDDLFGNETDTGDHLAYGTGVVVPGAADSRYATDTEFKASSDHIMTKHNESLTKLVH